MTHKQFISSLVMLDFEHNHINNTYKTKNIFVSIYGLPEISLYIRVSGKMIRAFTSYNHAFEFIIKHNKQKS